MLRFIQLCLFLSFLVFDHEISFAQDEDIPVEKEILSPQDLLPQDPTSPIKIEVPKQSLIPIYALYKAYKDRNFEPLIQHTTGKFGDYIQKVSQYSFENSGKFPPNISGFADRLKGMKVINGFMHDQNAYITVFWTLIVRSRHQTGGYYTQVYQISYLIVQENKKWKIKDSKTSQEFAIYNH